MKASDFDVVQSIVCDECGRTFTGRRNKNNEWVSPHKQLAGHIMASPDHPRKRWARKVLLDADVGTGLAGDYSRITDDYSRWH